MTCLRHRDLFGSRWQSGTPICTIPDEIAAHKSSSVKGLCGLRSNQSHMFTLYSLSLFQRAHVSLMVLYGSRPENDPSTANDPQIGPQMIPRQVFPKDCTANDGIFAANQSWPMKEMSALRNLDRGFISSIFSLKITNSQFKCNRCYS